MRWASTAAMVEMALICLLHLTRIIRDVDVLVANTAIPMWPSYVGVIGLPVLIWGLWREGRH